MYRGKHANAYKSCNRKPFVLLISLVLLAALAVGGTFAYLKANTDPVINTFTAGTGGVEIIEEKTETVKTSIKIKNTGNVPAYIRVAVVANHIDADGNVIGGNEIAIPASEKWQKLSDGFYYYKGIVAAGGQVEFLKSPLDYTGKEIDVMAQTIQAAGGFVSEKWKHSFNGNEWS